MQTDTMGVRESVQEWQEELRMEEGQHSLSTK